MTTKINSGRWVLGKEDLPHAGSRGIPACAPINRADTWVRPYKKYPFESNSALTVKNRKPTTLNRKLSSLHHHILTTFDFQEVDPVGAGPHHVVLLAKGELAGDAVEVFHSI
jgi:hypothetical protein